MQLFKWFNRKGWGKEIPQVKDEQDIPFQSNFAFVIELIHFIGSANQMAVSNCMKPSTGLKWDIGHRFLCYCYRRIVWDLFKFSFINQEFHQVGSVHRNLRGWDESSSWCPLRCLLLETYKSVNKCNTSLDVQW